MSEHVLLIAVNVKVAKKQQQFMVFLVENKKNSDHAATFSHDT